MFQFSKHWFVFNLYKWSGKIVLRVGKTRIKFVKDHTRLTPAYHISADNPHPTRKYWEQTHTHPNPQLDITDWPAVDPWVQVPQAHVG